MEPNTKLNCLIWQVSNDVTLDQFQQLDGERGYFWGVSVEDTGQTTDHHVCISDCFNLVDLVTIYSRIEHAKSSTERMK